MDPLARFLLHDDSMVRDSVGFALFESWSKDPALVPLVLESCRSYGVEDTLNLLGFTCRFPLDSRGLVESLRALTANHPPFVEQWVAAAPLELTASRAELVRSVLSSRAMARLTRRGTFHRLEPRELWRRLEALSSRMDEGASERGDWNEVDDLVEALSHVERRERVLERIATLFAERAAHFRWAIVDLAGAMELEAAVDSLVGCLGASDDGLGRAAASALARIGSTGSTDCLSLIRAEYPQGDRRFRRFAVAALKGLRSEAATALLCDLVEDEDDPALRGRLFDALRFHFSEPSARLLKRELEKPSSWMIPEDIQKALVVSYRIRGEVDPVVDRWREELAARGDLEIYFDVPFLGLDADGTDR